MPELDPLDGGGSDTLFRDVIFPALAGAAGPAARRTAETAGCRRSPLVPEPGSGP